MPNILITNSFSNNRGDEAAMRGLMQGIQSFIPDVRFTVFTMNSQGLALFPEIKILDFFKISKRRFFLIILWAILKRYHLSSPSFFTGRYKNYLKIMTEADIIISAPSGPIFGDFGGSIELHGLIHILLAKILKKPIMIYAPSMGPFNKCNRKRNFIRRLVLNCANIITLRESISKKYLDELKLTYPIVYVTADSALQNEIKIDSKKGKELFIKENFFDIKTEKNRKPLVGITPVFPKYCYDYTNLFEYIEIMSSIADFVIEEIGAFVVFIPQVYGEYKDIPLIKNIRKNMRHREKAGIFPGEYDSSIQQFFISNLDFLIGNRYHSIIFAAKMQVPFVAIIYQHKTEGFLKLLGLEWLGVNNEGLTEETLSKKVKETWGRRLEIIETLKSKGERMKEKSFFNSHLTKILYESYQTKLVGKKDLQSRLRYTCQKMVESKNE